MPALVEIAGVPRSSPRHGVSARELLDLRSESRRWISAHALEGWLVASGFATPNGEPGRLMPTQLAIEIGGALDSIGSQSFAASDGVVRLCPGGRVARL